MSSKYCRCIYFQTSSFYSSTTFGSCSSPRPLSHERAWECCCSGPGCEKGWGAACVPGRRMSAAADASPGARGVGGAARPLKNNGATCQLVTDEWSRNIKWSGVFVYVCVSVCVCAPRSSQLNLFRSMAKALAYPSPWPALHTPTLRSYICSACVCTQVFVCMPFWLHFYTVYLRCWDTETVMVPSVVITNTHTHMERERAAVGCWRAPCAPF